MRFLREGTRVDRRSAKGDHKLFCVEQKIEFVHRLGTSKPRRMNPRVTTFFNLASISQTLAGTPRQHQLWSFTIAAWILGFIYAQILNQNALD